MTDLNEGVLPQEFVFPDLEFDHSNLRFIDLEDETVISIKFYDQLGNELHTKKILNGIMYYFTMRASANFNPDYESSKKFMKNHPSCK